jgi:GT2 family glycosyltransferase
MTHPAPDVSVVLVTWNSARFLPSVLASLGAQEGVTTELVVVDNASADDSVAVATTLVPDARVIRNSDNRGFAAAVNQGVDAARAELVLLLNPDVVLDPAYCRELRDAVRADPRAAAATGTLFADAQRTVLDSTGHIVMRGGITWNRHGGAPASAAPGATNEVFGVSAAAAMYRRAALRDVDGPDGVLAASFFAYYEDVDLDWRLRWRGGRCLHVPAATAVHERSASGARRSAPIRRHQLANELLLLARVYPRAWLAAQAADLARVWAGRLSRVALSHPGDLVALLDVARKLPVALRVRRDVMRHRAIPAAALERWLEPRPW